MNDKNWLEKIHAEVEEERRNYNGPYCCLTMNAEISNKGTILCYDQKYREYGIKIPKSTGCMLMDHCMFCGKKLPLSVRDEWFDILEKEYGLEDPYWPKQNKKKIPKEFLTNEWWKKRGL